jgi:chitin disaccharide deacetylase
MFEVKKNRQDLIDIEGIKKLGDKLLNKKSLIINADDFGKDNLINEAIVFCFNHNLINSTSLMVTETGFEEAISFIKKYDYKNVGIHINLTDGKPISNFDIDFFLQENGFWDPNKVWSPRILKKEVSMKFEKEITEQIEKMIEHVFLPQHINSHNHCHTTPFLFPIFLKVAQKFRIKLRLAQSYYENSYVKYYYRVGINQILKAKGLAFSDSFESIDSWKLRKNLLDSKRVEIMVHPVFLSDYSKIIDGWDQVDFVKHLDLI